jgi:hypothetical protein
MSKFKVQMADDGVQTTSTKLTDTDHGHEHEREMPNVKAQMPKGKIQMTNDGVRNTSTGTSTKYTDTRVNVKVQSWKSLENWKNEL